LPEGNSSETRPTAEKAAVKVPSGVGMGRAIDGAFFIKQGNDWSGASALGRGLSV
jgi:hypothetical protein